MAFAIPTVTAKLKGISTGNSISSAVAVAQVNTTQQALLYGVEVTCKNGFRTGQTVNDPSLDIIVFTNPQAAKQYVEELGATWDDDLRLSSEENFNDSYPQTYILTAQRAKCPEDYVTGPIGISGSNYAEEPIPFVVNLENEYVNRSYLTIVAVFNDVTAITSNNELDEDVCIRAHIIYS